MGGSSWVGSVWSQRKGERIVLAEVRALDGAFLTLAVVGVATEATGGKRNPPAEGSDQVVQVSTESLLTRWQRVSGPKPGPWIRYRLVP